MFLSYNKQDICDGKAGFTTENLELWNGAHHLSGLDWNYLIAPYLDRDLHEKLLEVTQTDVQPIAAVLTGILSLIRSGYFYTAKLQVAQLDVTYSEKLVAIKTWLLQALTEADDTED
jgi:hypothetical protein